MTYLFYGGLSHAQDLGKVRFLYTQAAHNESACKQLLAVSAPFEARVNAVMSGYQGAATMMMAKYLLNPVDKLVWFRRGKGMLEDAIRAGEGCLELRFLRYCVQVNCPWFLGYHGDIRADRVFLDHGIAAENDIELKKMIESFLRRRGL